MVGLKVPPAGPLTRVEAGDKTNFPPISCRKSAHEFPPKKQRERGILSIHKKKNSLWAEAEAPAQAGITMIFKS